MNSSVAPTLTESWLELPDGRQYWLKARCTIGRHADNDLIFDAHTVSRHHALLVADAGVYTLSDLHSSNGTFVNWTPVTRGTRLRDGDELRFGDAVVRYRCTREAAPEPATFIDDRTRQASDVRERVCWLLLADLVGFSALNARLGSKEALQHFKAWIGGMRPLIERHGGYINSYVGDAIFAWWPAEKARPEQVRAALAAIESWRGQSPVAFRIVAHHGVALFTHSERGEELTGPDVNFVFRVEKVAKTLGSTAMLSEPAARSLEVAERCKALGRSTVEGFPGEFAFFGFPEGEAV